MSTKTTNELRVGKKPPSTYVVAIMRRLVADKTVVAIAAGQAASNLVRVTADLQITNACKVKSIEIENVPMELRRVRKNQETGEVVGPTERLVPVLKVTFTK